MEGGTLSLNHEHAVGEMAGPAAQCGARMLCCRCSASAEVIVNSRMCTDCSPFLSDPLSPQALLPTDSCAFVSHSVSECEAAE